MEATFDVVIFDVKNYIKESERQFNNADIYSMIQKQKTMQKSRKL